jgi:hypothetical protein
MTTEKGKVVQHGMGGFLCPPGHPMHHQSVETDLRRKAENRGCMSLDSALECEYLDDVTKAVVRTVLNTWEHNKPALDSPEIQEWILQVLGYFKGCYNLTPENDLGWYAVHLTIDGRLDPLAHARFHAGVHCIRKYYPDFQPTAEHFARAYWGTKPEKQ